MTKREDEINERRRVKLQEDKLFVFRMNLDYLLQHPEYESKLKEWLELTVSSQKAVMEIVNYAKLNCLNDS